MEQLSRIVYCPSCGKANSLPQRLFKEWDERRHTIACAICKVPFALAPKPEPNLIWAFNLEGEFLGEFPKTFAPELYHSQLQLVEVS